MDWLPVFPCPGAVGAVEKVYVPVNAVFGCNPLPPQLSVQFSREFGAVMSTVPLVVPEGVPGEKVTVLVSNPAPVVGVRVPKKYCPLIVDVLNTLSVCTVTVPLVAAAPAALETVIVYVAPTCPGLRVPRPATVAERLGAVGAFELPLPPPPPAEHPAQAKTDRIARHRAQRITAVAMRDWARIYPPKVLVIGRHGGDQRSAHVARSLAEEINGSKAENAPLPGRYR